MKASKQDDVTLVALLEALVATRHFDDAAGQVLQAMLRMVDRALAGGAHADRSRVLRGIVHLRPQDGYRRLWVTAYRGQGHDASAGDACLSSATAWRWVAEHCCPVAIDVELALAHPRLPGAAAAGIDAGTQIAFQGTQTLGHMRERNATHVYVLPLARPTAR